MTPAPAPPSCSNSWQPTRRGQQRRAAVSYHAARRGSNWRPRSGVAQWQSERLLIARLWVRVPPPEWAALTLRFARLLEACLDLALDLVAQSFALADEPNELRRIALRFTFSGLNFALYAGQLQAQPLRRQRRE